MAAPGDGPGGPQTTGLFIAAGEPLTVALALLATCQNCCGVWTTAKAAGPGEDAGFYCAAPVPGPRPVRRRKVSGKPQRPARP